MGEKREWKALIVCSLLAGFLANIPTLFSIDPEWFVPRNIGLIVFLPLLLFVIWQQKTKAKQTLVGLAVILFGPKTQFIENQIGRFIPFYIIWAMFVSFFFPLVF